MNNHWLALIKEKRKEKWHNAVNACTELRPDEMKYLATRIMQYVYDLQFAPRLAQEDMIEPD